LDRQAEFQIGYTWLRFAKDPCAMSVATAQAYRPPSMAILELLLRPRASKAKLVFCFPEAMHWNIAVTPSAREL
jgi:hypothetical protein